MDLKLTKEQLSYVKERLGHLLNLRDSLLSVGSWHYMPYGVDYWRDLAVMVSNLIDIANED